MQAEHGSELTPMQQRILQHLLRGASEKSVATSLNRSVHTVHSHVKAIYRRFHVGSRGELLSLFVAPQYRSLHRGNPRLALEVRMHDIARRSNAREASRETSHLHPDAVADLEFADSKRP